MAQRSLTLFKDYRHLARLFYSGRVFVAFDTETTGLNARSDFLMEIGAVKFTSKGEISHFDSLIKPPCPIPTELSQLTHITEDMVLGCPSADKVVIDFLKFIGGSNTVLIAHNAPFDMYFVNNQLERSALPALANTVIDTLPLSRWAYPKLSEDGKKGHYRLQALAEHFGIDVRAAHRANDDARVLKEIFLRILNDTMSVQKGLTPGLQSALNDEGTLPLAL